MRRSYGRLRLLISFLVAVAQGSLPSANAQTSQRGVAPVGSQATTSPPQPGPYYALVIGIDNYQYLRKLETAVNDADEVAETLRDRYGFEVKVLRDATRDDIFNALDQWARGLPDDASLLIYYGGHGAKDPHTQRTYWLPADAKQETESRWIMADDITGELRAIPARHVLVVADSCYSGTLFRDMGSLVIPGEVKHYFERILEPKSRHLMSSGGDEPVADAGSAGHSIFAKAFLQGLKSMDENTFTADDLFKRFIQRQVGAGSDQLPEYNPIRNSGDEVGGQFVFFRVSASAQSNLRQRTASGGPIASGQLSAGQTNPVTVNLQPVEPPPQPKEQSAAATPSAVKADTSSAAPAAPQPRPSANPSDPLAPHDPGIYYIEPKGTGPRMVRLEQAPSSAPTARVSTRGSMLGGATGFVGRGTTKPSSVILGPTAQARITELRPSFYFYFRSANATAPGGSISVFQSASGPTEFVLARLESKKNRREIPTVGGSFAGASASVRPKDAVPFGYEEVAAGIYRVQPRGDLKPGEYGFLYGGNFAGVVPAGGGWLFDFGIDKGK